MSARDYETSTGTFTTRDPLDGVNGKATVANPYAYGDNDPLNRVDPTGKRTTDVDYDPVDIVDPLPPVLAQIGGFVSMGHNYRYGGFMPETCAIGFIWACAAESNFPEYVGVAAAIAWIEARNPGAEAERNMFVEVRDGQVKGIPWRADLVDFETTGESPFNSTGGIYEAKVYYRFFAFQRGVMVVSRSQFGRPA